jgi:hypothetical protein
MEKLKMPMDIQPFSFSRLSLLDKSPYLFYKKYILGEEIEYKESTAMNLGSAVDCLLSQPDKFYNLFYVSTSTKPTGQMENFVNKLIDLKEITDDAFNEAYSFTQTLNGGKLRDGIDKFIERFHKEARKYFDDKVNSEGKIVLTFEEYTKAEQAANILKTNIFTSKFLSENLGEGIDRYYQHDEIFEHNGLFYKVILDLVIVNHNDQTIHPIDIKTTSESPYGFTKSMHKYRYDLQAAIYSHYIHEKFVKDKDLETYAVQPFKFIVINVEYPNNPLIYKMSHHDMIIAKMGIEGGSPTKGLWNLIEDLKWHISNDLWEYKREIYESNGEIVTNMYDKTIF